MSEFKPLSFDDPKPKQETRVMQTIYLLPSLRARIDALRGRVTRSEWIERAIVLALRDVERGE